MPFNIIFVFALLLLGQKVYSNPCNCGLGAGDSICECKEPLVVRPQHLPPIEFAKSRVVCQTVEGVNALTPVGDLCSCGSTIVKPAVLPQLQCASQSSSASSSQCHSSASINSHHGVKLEYPHCGLPVLPKAIHKIESPADAVSLAIALKQSQQKHDAVDKHLQFGFKKLPAEIIVTKKIAFPEEKLYKLNGAILELKAHRAKTTIDEEALEDLHEEEPEPEEILHHHVSFGGLGYIPRKVTSPSFTNVATAAEEPASCAPEPAPTCNDGYVAGQAIIKNEKVFFPSVCQDRKHHGHALGGSYSYSSSSSSSSCKSDKKHSTNVFFEKLGCA